MKVNLERTGVYTVGTENHAAQALAAARSSAGPDFWT